VVRPGTYEFAGSESLGLLEAVGMAGGFTRIADRGRILVKRRDGDLIHTMKVNAKKLSDGGLDRFELLPGDVINVGESWY
jgi:polysaccharide export outer membrane protein